MKRFFLSFFLITFGSSHLVSDADILDYYMMAVLPSIASMNSASYPVEPIYTPILSTDSAANTRGFNNTVVHFANGLKKYRDSSAKLVGVASGNFSESVDEYEMSLDDLKKGQDILMESMSNMATLMLYTNYLNELQTKASMQVDSGVIKKVKPRIAFVTVAFFAGIAYAVGQGAKNVYLHVKDYTKVGEDTISRATGKELKHINTEILGISESATAQEALSKYNSMPFMKKANLLNNISKVNSEHGDDQTIVKARSGFHKLSRGVGKEALVTTVGVEVSIIGGQGIDKIAKAVGFSANAAAGIDLGVSILGGQPLDLLVTGMESEAKTNQTAPSSTMTHKEAINTLMNLRLGKENNIDKAIEAATKIQNETARLMPNAVVNADGSVDVPVPDWMDLKILDQLVDGAKLKIRTLMSEAYDLMITASNMKPGKLEGLTSEDEGILIDMRDLTVCKMEMKYAQLNGGSYKANESGDKYTLCQYYFYSASQLSSPLARQIDIVNNQWKGLYLAFYENGNPWEKATIKTINNQKIKDGLHERYYDNGILSYSAIYADGVLNGLESTYFQDGRLDFEYPWINGILNGVVLDYNENPYYLYHSIEYSWGSLTGKQIIYNPDGSIYRCEIYDDGNFVSNCEN